MSSQGRVLGCLADDNRRAILDILAGEGPLSATALAPHLSISRQGIAKHLQVMTGVGVVRTVPVGREVRYDVDPAPLRSTASWLESTARAWDDQLAVLKRAAEGEAVD